jgi:signal transduction histidine kinase
VVTAAQRIERSSRRMSALINDVLDFARGRLGGGIGVEFGETTTLGQSLEGVAAELREAYPDRQIVSDIAVDGLMRCDCERIQQLLSNLLGNALTHGRPGTPVRVRAALEGEDVVIEVHNDGEPIPADRLGKVFEPFWRRTASREGLGLGLYICSQIAKSHAGQLFARSSTDSGTTFIARLPIRA